jgi:hypothetical protein
MFGYWLVKKGDWLKYQNAFHNIGSLHRWMSGFRDLDLLWDWIREPNCSVDDIRTKYARARQTNVYGVPLEKVRLNAAEKIVDLVLNDPLLCKHESQRLARSYRENYGEGPAK